MYRSIFWCCPSGKVSQMAGESKVIASYVKRALH
jgi:hypothetical protein